MNNRELDELLRKASVPQAPESYWREFPGDVVRMATNGARGATSATNVFFSRPAAWGLGVGLAAACVVVAFLIGYRAGTQTPRMADAAALEKCLREVQTMFPNQVRAVIFDKEGPRLLLSDAADVPTSEPIYLKVCNGKGCEKILTFSGQRVPIDGELCEVLVNEKDDVLVVGQKKFWPGGMPADLRVEARTL
jgi:hypothetical protein